MFRQPKSAISDGRKIFDRPKAGISDGRKSFERPLTAINISILYQEMLALQPLIIEKIVNEKFDFVDFEAKMMKNKNKISHMLFELKRNSSIRYCYVKNRSVNVF